MEKKTTYIVYHENRIIDGKTTEMKIKLTDDEFRQYCRYMLNRESMGLIQEELPFLSSDEREFIMTGFLPGEWEEMFKEV